jgi:hypothetical protein
MAIAAIAAALTLNGFPGGAFTIRIAAGARSRLRRHRLVDFSVDRRHWFLVAQKSCVVILIRRAFAASNHDCDSRQRGQATVGRQMLVPQCLLLGRLTSSSINATYVYICKPNPGHEAGLELISIW